MPGRAFYSEFKFKGGSRGMVISEDVVMLDSVKGSHVFLVRAEENIFIDTGMPGYAGQIANELKSLGRRDRKRRENPPDPSRRGPYRQREGAAGHVRRRAVGARGGRHVHHRRNEAPRRQGRRLGADAPACAECHGDLRCLPRLRRDRRDSRPGAHARATRSSGTGASCSPATSCGISMGGFPCCRPI